MALTTLSISVLYTLFAVLSTVINIGSQMLSIWAFKGLYSDKVSILVGPEYVFHLIYDINFMCYIGGVIGFTFGFYVKYQLGKKYVFMKRISEVQQ